MNKKIAAEALRVLAKELESKSEYKFIKDPDHSHFPGVSFHRTETGWSNAIKDRGLVDGTRTEEQKALEKPVIQKHSEKMESASMIAEGICHGNYFYVSSDLEVHSKDQLTLDKVTNSILNILENGKLDMEQMDRDGYLKILRGLTNEYSIKRIHLYNEMNGEGVEG